MDCGSKSQSHNHKSTRYINLQGASPESQREEAAGQQCVEYLPVHELRCKGAEETTRQRSPKGGRTPKWPPPRAPPAGCPSGPPHIAPPGQMPRRNPPRMVPPPTAPPPDGGTQRSPERPQPKAYPLPEGYAQTPGYQPQPSMAPQPGPHSLHHYPGWPNPCNVTPPCPPPTHMVFEASPPPPVWAGSHPPVAESLPPFSGNLNNGQSIRTETIWTPQQGHPHNGIQQWSTVNPIWANYQMRLPLLTQPPVASTIWC